MRGARLGLMMLVIACLGLAAGCALTMRQQPRYEPLEASTFFADGASARSPVANTVARGQLQTDAHLNLGRVNDQFVASFPFTITTEALARGQERYEIFCAPCHGLVGNGDGIITQYGMRQPTSFHDPELREEPVGYYFSLITNGTRIMPSYAARIKPEDRWMIVAYIRALQLSQNAEPSQIPEDEASRLE